MGIFRSLPAILLKQLPYTVTQLVTFELLTQVHKIYIHVSVCVYIYTETDGVTV